MPTHFEGSVNRGRSSLSVTESPRNLKVRRTLDLTWAGIRCSQCFFSLDSMSVFVNAGNAIGSQCHHFGRPHKASRSALKRREPRRSATALDRRPAASWCYAPLSALAIEWSIAHFRSFPMRFISVACVSSSAHATSPVAALPHGCPHRSVTTQPADSQITRPAAKCTLFFMMSPSVM